MKAIYLQKWTDQFQSVQELEAAKAEWRAELADLDGDQIRVGIERCRRELEWPPSAGQFRKAALKGFGEAPITSGPNGAAYRVVPSVARLGHKRGQEATEAGRSCLAGLRSALAGGAAEAPAMGEGLEGGWDESFRRTMARYGKGVAG